MKITISFLMCFTYLISSNAQETWTLERCVRHAIDNNLNIQQSSLSVENAKLDLSDSKQSRNPNLNGSTSAFWNFGRTVDPTTNEFINTNFFSNNFGLNSNAILWNGSRIKNTIKQSKVDIEAAEQDLEQQKQNTSLVVATNFLNILFAKERIDISERQLLLNQQQLNQLDKRIQAGVSPVSEKLNLEAQISQSEQALVASKNTLEIAYLNLKQSLQLSPSSAMEIEVPDNIDVDTDPDMISFDEAFELAKSNRPDLIATELRRQSADIAIDIAKSGYYPTLSIAGSIGTTYSNQGRTIAGFGTETIESVVNLSSTSPALPFQNVPVTISSENLFPIVEKQAYTDQLDQNTSYGFGFSLNVPIYNRGIVDNNVARAKLGASSNSIQHELLLNNLKITVQQSIADARGAKKQLEASTKTVEAQKLALENTSKRLEIGAANSFEWGKPKKTNLENAEINALIDKYNYLFSIKTLEFYLGKPLKL